MTTRSSPCPFPPSTNSSPSSSPSQKQIDADGRLDTVDQAGNAARRHYDDDYMTYASGYNSRGEEVPKDAARALAEAALKRAPGPAPVPPAAG